MGTPAVSGRETRRGRMRSVARAPYAGVNRIRFQGTFSIERTSSRAIPLADGLNVATSTGGINPAAIAAGPSKTVRRAVTCRHRVTHPGRFGTTLLEDIDGFATLRTCARHAARHGNYSPGSSTAAHRGRSR